MPNNQDFKYKRLKTIENVLDKVNMVTNVALKVADSETLKAYKKVKSNCTLMTRILKFLGEFKNSTVQGIISVIKNNSLINGAINLADRYLSVAEKITKLSFYNALSRCGTASTIINFIWWILELTGVIPKKKTIWFKILDGAIHIFGYLTGLTMDILDIIFNPFPIRKVAAVIEIILSTASLGIHLYNLIKDK